MCCNLLGLMRASAMRGTEEEEVEGEAEGEAAPLALKNPSESLKLSVEPPNLMSFVEDGTARVCLEGERGTGSVAEDLAGLLKREEVPNASFSELGLDGGLIETEEVDMGIDIAKAVEKEEEDEEDEGGMKLVCRSASWSNVNSPISIASSGKISAHLGFNLVYTDERMATAF